MTIKEKLYKEYVIVKNKVNALKGEELVGGDNVEEFFNSTTFSYNASKHTKNELRDMIHYAEVAYENAVKKKRVEDYFNTEEGMAEKESLLAEINKVQDERYNYVYTTTEEVDAFIKEWLGEAWGCGIVSESCLEIGIVEKKNDNNVNWFVFGHSFNVYYNDYFKKNRFEMNYSCMGAFDILNGSESGELRCKYLLGMATFANDKNKLFELEQKLNTFCKETANYGKKLDILRHNLKHPFDKKKVA